MAWVTPPTFSSGAVLTAAQMNILSGDLLETAPAKATAAGQMFVSTALNAIAVRTPTGATVVTQQTTSSATYTNLATVGPSVTVTTGASAIVWFATEITNDTAGHYSACAIDVSGATTIAATDATAVRFTDLVAASLPARYGAMQMYSSGTGNALTPGSNTFALKYRVQAGTDVGTFSQRTIAVLPL